MKFSETCTVVDSYELDCNSNSARETNDKKKRKGKYVMNEVNAKYKGKPINEMGNRIESEKGKVKMIKIEKKIAR